MGSAGFLVSASRYLKRKKDEWKPIDNINHFHRICFMEMIRDTTMLRLCNEHDDMSGKSTN